ncbi:MAG TPA: hypothetical protein VNV35_00165 [Puia sp.]|nr:hypothetical protein [Puia sp.]
MKKTLIAVWVIVLLVLTNLVTLYLLTRKSPGLTKTEFLQQELSGNYFNTIGPIPDAQAFTNVNGYRNNSYLQSNGVLYDPSDIQGYLANTLPGIETRMTNGVNLANYKWKIGFYFMLKAPLTGTKNRLAYCIVPTLVNKADTTQVVDYFNDVNQVYRHGYPSSPPLAGASCDTCNAYDEGQLWP